MATSSANNNYQLRQQVTEHGELLAEMGAIVKELHENAKDDRVWLKQVSEAVVILKERDAIRGKVMNWVIPLLTAGMGILAGHFWH
jgi:hypothetical protein